MMSVLLRLLSLLVVGCIVLQTLSVSGEEEFCELVNENALVEEYVREYAPKKPIPVKKVIVTKMNRLHCNMHLCYTWSRIVLSIVRKHATNI